MAPWRTLRVRHARQVIRWRMTGSAARLEANSTRMVGLGGLEPPTSRLSSARSNQLSYKPLSENIGGLQPQRHSPQAEARNSRHRGSTPTSEQKERRRRRRPANAVFDKTAVSKRPIKAFDKEDLNPQAIAGSEPLIRDMTLERR